MQKQQKTNPLNQCSKIKCIVHTIIINYIMGNLKQGGEGERREEKERGGRRRREEGRKESWYNEEEEGVGKEKEGE